MDEADLQTSLVYSSRAFPIDKVLYIGPEGQRFTQVKSAFRTQDVLHLDPARNLSLSDAKDSNSVLLNDAIVLSNKTGIQTAYKCNNKSLSGLISPEKLRQYWRNLRVVEEYQVNTTTLDELLVAKEELALRLQNVNWIIIDALAAGQILSGALGFLQRVDGVVLRVLRQEPVDEELRFCSLPFVDKLLRGAGFTHGFRAPDMHAEFVLVGYFRDWRSRFNLEEKYKNELQADFLEQLRVKSDELDDLTRQIVETENDLAQAKSLLSESQKEIERLKAERESLFDRFGQHLENETTLNEQLNTKLDEVMAGVEAMGEKMTTAVDSVARIDGRVSNVSSQVDDAKYLQLTSFRRSRKGLMQSLTERANQLYASHEFKRSAELYQAILKDDTHNAWAMQGLAESLARMEYEKDENWYNLKNAEDIEATGKWDVTVRLYRKALRLDANISRVFNDTFLKGSPDAKNSGVSNPLFIVGCGHSGTSIMLRILGNHSKLMPIAKETATFLSPDSTVRFRLSKWDNQCLKAGSERWIEKTPPHIFQIQRFLHFRPHAQFILMLRDGRDVVCSLRKRQGYDAIGDRLERWVYDNKAGLPFWEHPQVKVVKYENLVESPIDTLRDVCTFLSLDFESEMLDYHKERASWYSQRKQRPKQISNHSDHNAFRNWQINQALFDGRGKWKTEMAESEKTAFKESEAQLLLERFGYAEGKNW